MSVSNDVYTHADYVQFAVAANNGLWPDELYSGVMFYMGERITRQEFEKAASQ